MAQPSADIGLIGLAVMGENLVLNMESHGYTVAVFNRTTSKVDELRRAVEAREEAGRLPQRQGSGRLAEAAPQDHDHGQGRRAVDAVIDELVPLLEPGDILIDGGNTHYPDTTRRTRALKEKGLLFVGTGVSGGEEGALKGPSIMPGGEPGGLAERSSRSSRRSPPRSTTAPPAATGSATKGPATTSRWSTTASSTATSSSSARPTTS